MVYFVNILVDPFVMCQPMNEEMPCILYESTQKHTDGNVIPVDVERCLNILYGTLVDVYNHIESVKYYYYLHYMLKNCQNNLKFRKHYNINSTIWA